MIKVIHGKYINYILLLLLPLSLPAISDDHMKPPPLPPAIIKKLNYPTPTQINHYPEDSADFANLLALSNAGYAQFNYILGRIYSDGRLDESEKDYKASKVYYEKAIEQYARHTEALLELGVLYQRGLGTPKNIHKAISLYERAGEAGSAIAYNNLSVIYVLGRDIPQDFSKAKVHTQNAAHLGDSQSLEVLKHWDYYVEISSTQDSEKIKKIVEKYKKIEMQKNERQ